MFRIIPDEYGGTEMKYGHHTQTDKYCMPAKQNNGQWRQFSHNTKSGLRVGEKDPCNKTYKKLVGGKK